MVSDDMMYSMIQYEDVTVKIVTHSSCSGLLEVFALNLALLECVYILLSFLRPLNYYNIKSTFLYDFNLFFYGLLSTGEHFVG